MRLLLPSIKAPPSLYQAMAAGLLIFVLSSSVSLQADDEPSQFQSLTADQMKLIREKSLNLLRDIAPAGSSGREMETIATDDGLVDWGNLFDSKEVVALVNLAPEQPAGDDWPPTNSWGAWPCYLSLCAWEKDHWVYREYLDNANTLVFHTREDSPHHFVQASRKTGRYDGDFLSWYYDAKTKTLIRTNYESWGPFYLLGNYLCTTRGFERRAMDETVWVYPYKNGKKGELLSIYGTDEGTGESTNFSITFHDHLTGQLWTYSFHPEESEPPLLNYTIDAVEGQLYGKVESGFGIFSLGMSNAAKVYISGQMDHHKDVTFKEEFLTLLKRYQISYDERFLWD